MKKYRTSDWGANSTWSQSVSYWLLKHNFYIGDNEYQSELDRVFNTLAYVGEQEKIQHQIYTKLDPLQKGYVELEDLTNLVSE